MNSIVEQQVNEFCENYRLLNYRKGDIVIRGDDEPTGVYFLRSGTVKMSSINEEGEEMSVNIYKSGTFFPMTWALADIPNTYNYQTLSDAQLVRVPKDKFVKFIEKYPAVLLDLTKRILVGLDGLVFNMRYLIGGRSEAKVAVVLYTMARRFGVVKGNQIEIGVKLSHHDLSRFAGLTRETTTLTINKMEKTGIISQKQRKIIVKNMELLKKSF